MLEIHAFGKLRLGYQQTMMGHFPTRQVDKKFISPALKQIGLFDESKPDYTQTIGWKLAEILPSWLQ